MTANLHKMLSTSAKISYFCSMNKKIHVISFQNPYPPTYGGVIDVYYKLKALKEEGFYITLHTYTYGDRASDVNKLLNVANEILFYKRDTGWKSQLSLLPYIVNSRKGADLINNLLKDNAPILFEGLHTCYYLPDDRLKNRLKIVRTHNVEHDYYLGLYRVASSVKEKIFFAAEALKLKRYEAVLNNADYIMAISNDDYKYFTQRYPRVNVRYLPCFFDDTPSVGEINTEKYVLYHGNLSVEENITAVEWIISEIVPKLPDVVFKFAGSNPPHKLLLEKKHHKNVEFIINPDDVELNRLVEKAHINLLITFQSTGIKLKLLKALSRGAFVVTNTLMVKGSGLEENCVVADSSAEIVSKISSLMRQQFTLEQRNLRHLLSNATSIPILTSIID